MTMIHMFDVDAAALIGRDPRGLAEEYSSDRQDNIDLLVAERDAMDAMIQLRALRLAPTKARQIAVDLVPALCTLCRTMEAVDLLVALARDWVADMGDVAAHARSVDADRKAGQKRADAALRTAIAFNADAVFDVHDAATLSVTLEVNRRDPVMVGLHNIDDEGGRRADTQTPELVA